MGPMLVRYAKGEAIDAGTWAPVVQAAAARDFDQTLAAIDAHKETYAALVAGMDDEAFRGEIAGFDGAKTTLRLVHRQPRARAMRGVPDAAVPVPESLRPRGIEHGEPVGRRRSTSSCVDMEFTFDTALPVLRRTPSVLADLLADLSSSWTDAVEGPNTWSPFDVVGHLIHGERTDWVPRIEHLLRHGDAIPFPPFDREAMFAASQGKSVGELLDIFARLRTDSLNRLVALGLSDEDLSRRGRHRSSAS